MAGDRASSSLSASPASGRPRCSTSWRDAPSGAAAWPFAAAQPSSSRSCRLGSSSMPSTSTSARWSLGLQPACLGGPLRDRRRLPRAALPRAGLPGPTTAAERFRAHHAVRDLIERLAGPQPLVLVLEDLHWADGASIELVSHLLRRPPQAPCSWRHLSHGPGRPRPGGAIAAAGAEGDTVRRLALGPLTPASKLVDAAGAAELEQLYRASGGNPFYMLQLARAERTGHGSRRGAEVPPAVVAAIVGELDGLTIARAGSRRRRRWPAIPSSSTWPGRGWDRGARRPRRDRRAGGTRPRRPATCRDASASAIRSCAAPSMSRPRRASGWRPRARRGRPGRTRRPGLLARPPRGPVGPPRRHRRG